MGLQILCSLRSVVGTSFRSDVHTVLTQVAVAHGLVAAVADPAAGEDARQARLFGRTPPRAHGRRDLPASVSANEGKFGPLQVHSSPKAESMLRHERPVPTARTHVPEHSHMSLSELRSCVTRSAKCGLKRPTTVVTCLSMLSL